MLSDKDWRRVAGDLQYCMNLLRDTAATLRGEAGALAGAGADCYRAVGKAMNDVYSAKDSAYYMAAMSRPEAEGKRDGG